MQKIKLFEQYFSGYDIEDINWFNLVDDKYACILCFIINNEFPTSYKLGRKIGYSDFKEYHKDRLHILLNFLENPNFEFYPDPSNSSLFKKLSKINITEIEKNIETNKFLILILNSLKLFKTNEKLGIEKFIEISDNISGGIYSHM